MLFLDFFFDLGLDLLFYYDSFGVFVRKATNFMCSRVMFGEMVLFNGF